MEYLKLLDGFASGGFVVLLWKIVEWASNRRNKKALSEKIEIENDGTIVSRLEDKVEKQSIKIDKLHDDNSELHKDKLILAECKSALIIKHNENMAKKDAEIFELNIKGDIIQKLSCMNEKCINRKLFKIKD